MLQIKFAVFFGGPSLPSTIGFFNRIEKTNIFVGFTIPITDLEFPAVELHATWKIPFLVFTISSILLAIRNSQILNAIIRGISIAMVDL